MSAPAFQRTTIAPQLAALAAQGVYVGTSSWKYPGWCGVLYDESRYVYRGKFAEKRFEKYCLAEYAEVFKTVCVDAAYYKFPSRPYLDDMVSQTPPDFRFGFKVTDEITLKRFANLPRFGARAGQVNQNFLNADLFASAFLGPCEAIQDRVGLIMFEFSKFYPSDFALGRDWVQALDTFLESIPKGWPYGVEMRNRNFLHPDYFAVLQKHGVAHIYNSWSEMPSVSEQMSLVGSETNPELVGARFLLKPGRTFKEAVDFFQPYDQIKEPYPEARRAAVSLIQKGRKAKANRKTFIFINNRLEGNSLATIQALIAEAMLGAGQ